MIENLKEILIEMDIPYWKMILQDRHTAQISLKPDQNFDEKEIRSSRYPLKVLLTIFREFHKKGRKYLGRASIELSHPMDRDDVRSALQKAQESALEQDDPWYPLELKPYDQGQKELSSLEKQPLAFWLLPFHEAVNKGAENLEVRAGDQFLLSERENSIYVDAFGRELVHLAHRARVEVNFLDGEGSPLPRTTSYSFSEFLPDQIREFVMEEGRVSQDISRSSSEAFPIPGTVYLRGPVLLEIFSFVLRQVSGSAIYAGTTSAKLNRPIWDLPVQGDRMTVRALPHLYNSPFSCFFDNDGVAFQPCNIIEDGIVRGILTNQESAHYLALPLTGLHNNFAVSSGSLDVKDFHGEPYLEIKRMRTFALEEASGRFYGDVELAYWYDGNTRKPVRGLQLGGNLKALLTESLFSREIGSWEFYEGPEILKIPSSFVKGVV